VIEIKGKPCIKQAACVSDCILILSAPFGDGHHQAARGLAAGVKHVSAGQTAAPVHDLIREAVPTASRWVEKSYRWLISEAPMVWSTLYELAHRVPPGFDPLGFFSPIQRRLHQLIEDYQPRAIVSAYPLYAHLLHPYDRKQPFYTLVTDSITINRAWIDPITTDYLVADEDSTRSLAALEVDAARIVVTGFAIDPDYALTPAPPPRAQLQRVLFFAHGPTSYVETGLHQLLQTLDQRHQLTIVCGRAWERLHPLRTQLSSPAQGPAVEWIGWTDQVPALIRSHDLIIGKAGGATTHEVIGCGRPFLINQIVPGQEEGNALLAQRLGLGQLALDPTALARTLDRLIHDDGAWSAWSSTAWQARRSDGALRAATHVLRGEEKK
jgi:processive 1,2-diacylglycerol beta-glucosyltransferase